MPTSSSLTSSTPSYSIVDKNSFNSGSASIASRDIAKPSYAAEDLRTYSEPFSFYDSPRIESARQTATRYRSRAVSSPAVVASIANENARFAEQWAELAENIRFLSTRVYEANLKLNSTSRDFDDVGAKLKQYGLTPTIGLLLSHKKEQLDDWQVNGSSVPSASEEIQRSRQKQLELEMVDYDGSDATRQASEILSLSGYDSTSIENLALSSQIQTLLQERSRWLGLLLQGYNDYRKELSELDSTSAAFAKLTADYRRLINRHVTWIRSDEPLSFADVRNARRGLSSMFDSRRSSDFGYSVGRKWNSNTASGLALVGSVVIVFLLRWLAKFWLVGIGNRKRMRESLASTRKCVASILTTLVSLAFPAILYLIARWLGSGFVTESTLHASSGLYAASLVALVVEVPRQLLRKSGFVEKQLDMELPRRQRASAYLIVIGFGLVLAAYVVTLSGLIDHGIWSGSISRFGFLGAMLLVAWTAHLSLKPSGGFLEPLVAKFGGNVIYRMRFLIYFVGIGFPLAMIALSVLGYGFTANEFIKRAGWMFSGLLIAATLWAAVKILASNLWHLLTGTRTVRKFDEYGEIQPERVAGALTEHSLELKHQLAFLCQCALVLSVIVCMGWLWIDVFPNVRMGNPVVWTVQETVTQSFVNASGETASRTGVETTPITALHLLFAAVTLFVAFQLAKLLPALFDALVLQRVSFDEAMEHFSLVVGRCLLFGVGCFVACRWVGIRWEAIQWLAVGLAIGLGFGLQDMVRNLFGGLIVLFEKPARLGDLITVGNVTGRVSFQKLRTTVLSDDDGREVIVPNKNFVSEEVVNWMGAGRLSVIPIEVAVTRDERPADVCRMLQHLMVEQPEVLLSPAPQATLVCVSQKFQRIELRAWVEENLDATRFREQLHKAVLKFLLDKNLLAPTQPPQPSLRNANEGDTSGAYRSRGKRSA